MYSELPFASAQCLIEVPYNLAQALLFSLICYFMLGFDHDAGERSSPAAQSLSCLSICNPWRTALSASALQLAECRHGLPLQAGPRLCSA